MFIDNVVEKRRATLVAQFMCKVYAWMSIGLFITAGVAYGLVQELRLLEFILNLQWIFFSLIGAQIALVIYLESRLERLNYWSAAMLFVFYSALIGMTLSPIFIVYTMASIMQAFLIAAGMFGCMAFYGFVTKDDLTKISRMLMMGLFGLIIAQLFNIFFDSAYRDYYLSLFGVVLFSLLTAYDVQKLKLLSSTISVHDDEQFVNKIALRGALTLYLDFLNLFLKLLKIMGKKRK
jgi:FtsH-binding integral membrane protein